VGPAVVIILIASGGGLEGAPLGSAAGSAAAVGAQLLELFLELADCSVLSGQQLQEFVVGLGQFREHGTVSGGGSGQVGKGICRISKEVFGGRVGTMISLGLRGACS
jgi:hypothetical protein